MFKKNTLTFAIALSISALSTGVANAADASYPAGTPLTDGTTVSETSPTFVFDYDPAMSGVIVDLTEGLDAADDSVADSVGITKCGPVSETAFLGLADMNCSAAGCEWIPTVALKNEASYFISYEQVIAGAATLATRGTCTDATAGGKTFEVDTSGGGGGVVAPTAPPEQVVITTNPGDKCTTAVDKNCVIDFKHANDPAASHYRVWISDKNGIQIDEDKLTAKADQTVDVNGWFEVDTVGGTLPTTKARVACVPKLDGSRECKLEIEGVPAGGIHPVYADMKAGKKLKIWVRAWNAKGYADWSDSVEFDMD